MNENRFMPRANTAIEKAITILKVIKAHNPSLNGIFLKCNGSNMGRDDISKNIWLAINHNLVYINFSFSGTTIDTSSTYHLTEKGLKYIEKLEIDDSIKFSIYDNKGYLDYLNKHISCLDDVLESYIKESINALNNKCYISSVFCLGAASERLILLLQEAYCNALATDYSERKKQILKKDKIGEVFKAIKSDFEKINQQDKSYFKNLWETIISEIQAIFDLIRRSRNDAGHPVKIPEFDHFYTEGNLMIFPRYCINVDKIIEHLKDNSLPIGVNLP